jgi:type III pantothenate kinase
MLTLVIDAGNTLIKCAVYNQAELIAAESGAEWSVEMITGLREQHPAIASCLICSTRAVPEWIPALMEGLGIRFSELTHETPLPLVIGYETPATLGKDRIAAAAGAVARFPGRNIVVIDAGTALTIDLVTGEPVFLGGNISPGMRMRFHALHAQTFSLPEVEPGPDVPLIGKNTRQAILAGVVNGLTYEIDNSINSLKNKYNDLAFIITGGDAPYLAARLKNTIFVEENLVLNGLNAILRNFSE